MDNIEKSAWFLQRGFLYMLGTYIFSWATLAFAFVFLAHAPLDHDTVHGINASAIVFGLLVGGMHVIISALFAIKFMLEELLKHMKDGK